MARPSRGSPDNHVKWRFPVGDVNIVSPISTFVVNTLTLKLSAFFFATQVDVGGKTRNIALQLVLQQCSKQVAPFLLPVFPYL